jgi:predicted ATPase
MGRKRKRNTNIRLAEEQVAKYVRIFARSFNKQFDTIQACAKKNHCNTVECLLKCLP